jgi:hypothetical protein
MNRSPGMSAASSVSSSGSVRSSLEATVDRLTVESPERVMNTLFIVFPDGAEGDWGAVLESLLGVVVPRIRHERPSKLSAEHVETDLPPSHMGDWQKAPGLLLHL